MGVVQHHTLHLAQTLYIVLKQLSDDDNNNKKLYRDNLAYLYYMLKEISLDEKKKLFLTFFFFSPNDAMNEESKSAWISVYIYFIYCSFISYFHCVIEKMLSSLLFSIKKKNSRKRNGSRSYKRRKKNEDKKKIRGWKLAFL